MEAAGVLRADWVLRGAGPDERYDCPHPFMHISWIDMLLPKKGSYNETHTYRFLENAYTTPHATGSMFGNGRFPGHLVKIGQLQ